MRTEHLDAIGVALENRRAQLELENDASLVLFKPRDHQHCEFRGRRAYVVQGRVFVDVLEVPIRTELIKTGTYSLSSFESR